MAKYSNGRNVKSLADRIRESIVMVDSGCWIWQRTIRPNGYGQIGIGQRSKGEKRSTYSHRASYETFVGPIPEGLELDHLCRNRACCNPAHLEPVTRRENIRRGVGPEKLGKIHSNKTHCKNGHPFDEQNTYMRPSGGRACRACSRDKQHSYREAKNTPAAIVPVRD